MGLFGSDDESDASNDGADSSPSRPGGPPPRVTERIDAVFEASEPRSETRRLVEELHSENRTAAARALGRVMVADPGVVEGETVESAIDALVERGPARAIADGLLHEAEGLRWSGVESTGVAVGALDALGVALGEIESVRLDGGGVPAGGGAEVGLGQRLREHAESRDREAQFAYEATADAFERVPKLLARRAGADPIDAVVDLRVAHQRGEPMALDVESGRTAAPDAPSGSLDPTSLSVRLVDGVVLAVVVLLDRGTAPELESLTEYSIEG